MQICLSKPSANNVINSFLEFREDRAKLQSLKMLRNLQELKIKQKLAEKSNFAHLDPLTVNSGVRLPHPNPTEQNFVEFFANCVKY